MKYVLKGLEIRKRTLPGNHPAVADSYANLAMTYMSMKDYRNAYNNIHEAVRVAKRCPSGKHVRLETYKNMEKHIKSILR
jgi:Tfp pilus assembly protein PilF